MSGSRYGDRPHEPPGFRESGPAAVRGQERCREGQRAGRQEGLRTRDRCAKVNPGSPRRDHAQEQHRHRDAAGEQQAQAVGVGHQQRERAPERERDRRRPHVEDDADHADVEDEGGGCGDGQNRRDVECLLAARRHVDRAEQGEGRRGEHGQLRRRGQQAPHAIEEQDDGGAQRDGADKRRDAHAERHPPLALGAVDVEAAREALEQAGVVVADARAIAGLQPEHTLAFELAEFVREGLDLVRALLRPGLGERRPLDDWFSHRCAFPSGRRLPCYFAAGTSP